MNNKPEQIKNNLDKLKKIVKDNFEGDNLKNIKKLFNHFGERMVEAPASGRPNYHNCFMGGWIDHTLRVIETSLKMREHFVDLGVDVTAEKSDVILAAMFHDLGKLGDLDNPYYIYQLGYFPLYEKWRKDIKDFCILLHSLLKNLFVMDDLCFEFLNN